ncbi:MAG: YggS family pyridoxal phosphate-dependent enzyme [Lachnospiraceae bacterium]|nr:YggS family pyridoxal phosphate-dependent enzyme [Lachnospiraceae bacterium]
MSYLKNNLEEVNNIIKEHAVKVSRNPEDITLVAVSKTKPVEMLKEVYDLGVRDFGENYVQELVDKINQLPSDIRWHMIGHLQTNKIKYIIDKVYMIHSVDTLHLAQAISKEAVKRNLTVKILLEVNVADEESKFGLTKENFLENYKEMMNLPGIDILGLMTSAPYIENMEDNRQYFVQLRSLMIDLIDKGLYNKDNYYLSMGMTGDYPVAVEEGATLVRVGTGIFGARNYNI